MMIELSFLGELSLQQSQMVFFSVWCKSFTMESSVTWHLQLRWLALKCFQNSVPMKKRCKRPEPCEPAKQCPLSSSRCRRFSCIVLNKRNVCWAVSRGLSVCGVPFLQLSSKQSQWQPMVVFIWYRWKKCILLTSVRNRAAFSVESVPPVILRPWWHKDIDKQTKQRKKERKKGAKLC